MTGQQIYKIDFCKNIQTKTSAQCSKVGSMTTDEQEEEPSKHRAEKNNTLTDSNYFYTEELILRTKFCAYVTLFTCTLCTLL